jgi:hypothetical protein
MPKYPDCSLSPPRRYYLFHLCGTPTHHALHAFMVLWALRSSTLYLHYGIIFIEVTPLSPIALPSSCLPSLLLPTIPRCLGMSLSRESSEPRVASGFDILSDMIHHVHRTNHLDLSVFTPDQLPQTAASTLINVGRNLKSSFTGALASAQRWDLLIQHPRNVVSLSPH